MEYAQTGKKRTLEIRKRLFEYEELSYEEIAGVLQCSPKAVETRLYRARKILREKLERLALR